MDRSSIEPAAYLSDITCIYYPVELLTLLLHAVVSILSLFQFSRPVGDICLPMQCQI